MIVIAGGTSFEEQSSPEAAAASLRALVTGQVPDSVVAFNFQLLSANPDAVEYPAAWFASPTEPKSIVSAASRVLSVAKRAPEPSAAKTLRHYVLLPKAGLSQPAWDLVQSMASDGVIGFSAEEASQASLVTILGDEAVIPPSVERQLQQKGSQVRRVRTAIDYPVWNSLRSEQ